MSSNASNVHFNPNNLVIWNKDPLVSSCMFERVMLCCLFSYAFRIPHLQDPAGHTPAPMRRNSKAEQHLKLFVHCPSHSRNLQPHEATSSGTSQVGGFVAPHGWSLEIRNMHNSLSKMWFLLLFGEACTKATSLKPHYKPFFFSYFYSLLE